MSTSKPSPSIVLLTVEINRIDFPDPSLLRSPHIIFRTGPKDEKGEYAFVKVSTPLYLDRKPG
jgi:hypothetical protein